MTDAQYALRSGGAPAADLPEVSVAIPTYNEEENVQAIAAAAIAALETVTDSFEILFIDNASTDRTVPLVRDLCVRDPRIRLIVNTRNFGQMRSPTHVIYQARGRAVIGLCADFQDPPEMLAEFVRRWRQGADIVLGVRQSGRDSVVLRTARELAYAFAHRFGDYPIIPNATGFGLYDRRVVETLRKLNEPEPFFRGMLVESGYTIETIPYARPERAGGVSKNNFVSLLTFALSSLAAASKRLLRAPFFIGAFMLAFAGLLTILTLYEFAAGIHGWACLVVTAFEGQLGVLFLFLGMLGDQVRLIAERTRGTPLVFERERVNFPEADA